MYEKIIYGFMLYLFVAILTLLAIAPYPASASTYEEKERVVAIALTWPVHAIVLTAKGIWYVLTLLTNGVIYAF